MGAFASQLGPVHYAALAGALLLSGLGLWALWAARHRADGERVVVPGLGLVGVPTCLTLGLCLLILGYHLAAYGLLPVFTLWAVPVDRWWILLGGVAVAMGSSLASDWFEARHHDT